jgi:hypothetical protein
MTTSSSRADVGSDHDIITDFGITSRTLDMLVLSGMTSADLVLTDVAGGARVSLADPAYSGDVLVLGVTSSDLSTHLLL